MTTDAPPQYWFCNGHNSLLRSSCFTASCFGRRHHWCRECNTALAAKYYRHQGRLLRPFYATRKALRLPNLTIDLYRSILEAHNSRCWLTGAIGDVGAGGFAEPLHLIRVCPGDNGRLVPAARRAARLAGYVLPQAQRLRYANWEAARQATSQRPMPPQQPAPAQPAAEAQNDAISGGSGAAGAANPPPAGSRQPSPPLQPPGDGEACDSDDSIPPWERTQPGRRDDDDDQAAAAAAAAARKAAAMARFSSALRARSSLRELPPPNTGPLRLKSASFISNGTSTPTYSALRLALQARRTAQLS